MLNLKSSKTIRPLISRLSPAVLALRLAIRQMATTPLDVKSCSLASLGIKPVGWVLLPIAVSVSSAAYAESWKVNLQDADIKAFINEVATITNQNFVLDPRINGNVTVISNRALSKDEIYQLFLSVMQVNGIAAIETGTTIKLVPDNVAKSQGIEVDLDGEMTGEAMATRVVYLDNISAAEVLTVIRPLMPQSAHAAAVPGSNALVLSDRAESLNQIMTLVRSLDGSSSSELSVIPLQHVDPERMMDLISSLTDTANGDGKSGGGQMKVIADTASDRLLVQGSPEMIAKVQAMVAQLDVRPSKRLSGLRVFRLKYASAAHVANMLRGLISYQSINSTGAVSTLESASLTGNATNVGGATTAAATNNNASSSSSGSSSNPSDGGRRFSIIADETQNAIIVNGDPELVADVEAAINKLDYRRAQVLIQAAIIEVSGTDAKQLGVQWALGNANSGYGVVNFNNKGVSATSLATAALSGVGVSEAASAIAGALLGLGDSKVDGNGNRSFYGAILQALDSTTSANLLSMPSILALDNEKASILVGQNVPFVTGSYTTQGNSSTNPFQTIDRQDVGINLNVIPHVGENGVVRLEVSQEVSSVVNGTTGNAAGLITNKSFIDTTILAHDQQTVALGGLMRDNTTNGAQKVPVLGDLPLVGRLFRSDEAQTEKSNLIIFLQPTILRNGGAVASVTEKRYDQMRVMQLTIDKNGTIKKIPLSGTTGWDNNAPNVNDSSSQTFELAPLNPVSDYDAPVLLPPSSTSPLYDVPVRSADNLTSNSNAPVTVPITVPKTTTNYRHSKDDIAPTVVDLRVGDDRVETTNMSVNRFDNATVDNAALDNAILDNAANNVSASNVINMNDSVLNDSALNDGNDGNGDNSTTNTSNPTSTSPVNNISNQATLSRLYNQGAFK